MSAGERLPDEIVLTRDEAATVLFALDAAATNTQAGSPLHDQLADATDLIVRKFLPDLGDL